MQLPSGAHVTLPVCKPVFAVWPGRPTGFTFGGKPLVKHNGKRVFAELAILDLLLAEGWQGVWVARPTIFLNRMPLSAPMHPWSVEIPEEKHRLLEEIWRLTECQSCFDVFAWRGKAILFCESKRARRDRLRPGQRRFIEAALSRGATAPKLLIAEWRRE